MIREYDLPMDEIEALCVPEDLPEYHIIAMDLREIQEMEDELCMIEVPLKELIKPVMHNPIGFSEFFKGSNLIKVEEAPFVWPENHVRNINVWRALNMLPVVVERAKAKREHRRQYSRMVRRLQKARVVR